ncbi:hypothetical protein EJ06DRAFT_494959 [Trichodelitschia bisporula]|uniref:Uncharacterized protein n=1 Tax=Trichodelitschia bisporula TaxID=703511 RepID=A0A6G1HW43_9PEZI|nr:hypothetical protein EJ06DRAFT_494959 [Trichodelitschia bisporula]
MAPTPTLINLPPPPSDPTTPSEIPGTPNSTVTSMSELSTVAIKDGHRGHLPHNHLPLDAERADRISRLAGLERVAGPRTAPQAQNPVQNPGYFDASGTPQLVRERSTVGSASATGSVGGRTTWASGSDVYDPDKMSEVDQDVDASSVGGFSDEGTAPPSLVGFGEGARTPARGQSSLGSPVAGKASAVPSHLREQPPASPLSSVSGAEAQKQDAKMIDGVTYDPDVLDTTTRTPPLVEADPNSERGAETTERIMRQRGEREAEAKTAQFAVDGEH